MISTYTLKLGFVIRKIDIGTQKIDSSIFITYKMVIASLSLQNKFGYIKFFEKTFLLAEISIQVVLEMSFLSLSNADI